MPGLDHHWTELLDSQYLLLTFFLLVTIMSPGSTRMMPPSLTSQLLSLKYACPMIISPT